MPFGLKNKDDRDLVIRLKNQATGEKIKIYDFKEQMDTIDKNIIKAKVEIGENNAVNICFRNPQNIPIDIMRKQFVFDALVKIGALENLQSQRYNYLGTIKYDKKKKQFNRLNPESEEELENYNYVRQKMDTQLAIYEENQSKEQQDIQETEQSEKIDNKTESREQQFKDGIILPEETRKKMEEYFSRKQENRKHPFLRESYIIRETENQIEKEKILEGVDKTTGEYLILKNLENKQIDGKYIYTGNLIYLDNLVEKQTKQLEELQNYEVIFELPDEIDKMMKQGRTDSLIELLEKTEKLLQKDMLNMIGKVEEDGKVYRHPYVTPDKIFDYYKEKAKEFHDKNNKGKNEVAQYDNLVQFDPTLKKRDEDYKAI